MYCLYYIYYYFFMFYIIYLIMYIFDFILDLIYYIFYFIYYVFFPECVARVPVSLWGCGGRGVFAGCCPTVRNRSQPSATVRNRPR